MRSNQHKSKSAVDIGDGVCLISSAFKSRVASYKVTAKTPLLDLAEFFIEVKEKLIQLIQQQLDKLTTLKVNLELFGLYTIEVKNMTEIKSFNTANKVITLGSALNEIIDDFQGIIDQKMADFLERDSGELFTKTEYRDLLCFFL